MMHGEGEKGGGGGGGGGVRELLWQAIHLGTSKRLNRGLDRR